MSSIRYYPPTYLHEVTQRTIRGIEVFDPNSKALREALYGALAASQRRYGVGVVAFHFLSNHYHGLFQIQSATSFAKFLAHFHAGITRAWHRVCGTSGKLLGTMKCAAVAQDEASVRKRLDYIMGQAVRAKLVNHPEEFPGAASTDWMLHGTPLTGRYLDATQMCRDKRLQAGAAPEESYVRRLDVQVVPPPCWAALGPADLRQRYRSIANQIAGLTSDQGADEPPRAKVHIVPRQADDGGPYEAGPPKKKYKDSNGFSSKFPALFAVDADHVRAFEHTLRAVEDAYRRAKCAWLLQSEEPESGLRSAAIAIPAHTLLGTMPFLDEPLLLTDGTVEVEVAAPPLVKQSNNINDLTLPSANRGASSPNEQPHPKVANHHAVRQHMPLRTFGGPHARA
jgi:REP element-mobilizing transposase RayT